MIREEFIRNNHAALSKIYCMNLADKFDIRVIQDYGTLFSITIGELCLSHGADFADVPRTKGSN